MRFKIAFDFVCIFVLMSQSSWSWEINQFHGVKSYVGELLCGMSPANKTLNAVGSSLECISSCFHVCPSPCQAVNYWTNARLCEHFYYIPCSYDVQQECVNYQVTIVMIEFRCFEIVDCIAILRARGLRVNFRNVGEFFNCTKQKKN